MAIISRRPGRWSTLVFPPDKPRPRAIFRYATGGAWTLGRRVGFSEIAGFYAIPDVWDLIMYNFRCRNPAEVNWCLNHFLGCTKSADGKNYCFDRTDRNPIVAIPPIGFRAFTANDDRVRQLILETLAQDQMSLIRFEIGGLKITPAMFGKVATAVQTRSLLALELAPGAEPLGVVAMYNSVTDSFWVRNPARVTATKRAIIVHEAFHAAMDLTKQTGTVLPHEAGAHVAEALRGILGLADPGSANPASVPAGRHRFALRLALRAYQHVQASPNSGIRFEATDPDYTGLLGALAAIPEYGDRAGEQIGSNGI